MSAVQQPTRIDVAADGEWVCRACGAMVRDPNTHREWHAENHELDPELGSFAGAMVVGAAIGGSIVAFLSIALIFGGWGV